MSTKAQPFLSDRSYNALKWVAQIALPALGTAYLTLSQVLGLPAGPEVAGAVLVLDTLLGTLLGISTKSYNASGARYDGLAQVTINEEEMTRSLKLALPEGHDIDDKKELIFKVDHSSS